MKSLHVDLPDQLAEAVDAIIASGWCNSPDEVVRLALMEFVRHQSLEMEERFQLEDVEWALSQRPAK